MKGTSENKRWVVWRGILAVTTTLLQTSLENLRALQPPLPWIPWPIRPEETPERTTEATPQQYPPSHPFNQRTRADIPQGVVIRGSSKRGWEREYRCREGKRCPTPAPTTGAPISTKLLISDHVGSQAFTSLSATTFHPHRLKFLRRKASQTKNPQRQTTT